MTGKVPAKALLITYLLFITLLSVHYFRNPETGYDMLDFAGCVFAMKTSDPVQIHDLSYRAILDDAPRSTISHLLGTDQDTNMSAARRDRYANPYHFVQWLPYFSIKPLYIELIALMHRLGIRMFAAIVLASVLPAFGLMLVMYRSTVLLKGSVLLLCAFLLVPEIRDLGYGQSPDALSTLATFSAFVLIFLRNKFTPGILLMLISIWIRPDNVILTLAVLAFFGLRGRIPLWAAGPLFIIAFLTPIAISHYGGSYGWKALYSHTFKFVEFAPGEFVPTFTLTDYLQAARTGVRSMLNSSLIVYLGLAVIGCRVVPEFRQPLAICFAASVVHFVVYPNFEPRYYALFYALVIVLACVAAGRVWADGILTEKRLSPANSPV